MRWALAASLFAIASAPAHGSAHSLEFGVLRVQEHAGQDVMLTLRAGGREGQPPDLDLAITGPCALVGETRREAVSGVLVVHARATCVADATIEVVGLAESGIRIAVNHARPDGTEAVHFLDPASPRLTFTRAVTPSTGELFMRYSALGARHLAYGFDHLMFLLALLLVVRDRRVRRARPGRAMVLTVSGFTFGHAITLTLVLFAGLSLPSAPVEFCIALSIVFLAAELLSAHVGLLFHRPWMVATGFGLLHGLGFAGALQQIGLPPSDRPLALIAFHVGLELSQLIFVGAVWQGLRWAEGWSRSRVLPYALGLCAAVWVGLRVDALGLF